MCVLYVCVCQVYSVVLGEADAEQCASADVLVCLCVSLCVSRCLVENRSERMVFMPGVIRLFIHCICVHTRRAVFVVW